MQRDRCVFSSAELRRQTGGTIEQARRSFAHTLLAPSTARLFQEARSRHAALAGHDSLQSMLGVLGDESKERLGERDAILRALIAEAQTARTSVWSHLLLAAFYPMLARFRERTRGDDLPPEDLDQVVVTSFLDTVVSFPLGKFVGHTGMELKRRTWHCILAHLTHERQGRDLVDVVAPEDLLNLDPASWPETGQRPRSRFDANEDGAELEGLLVEIAGSALSRADIDLLAATNLRGQRLSIHVATLYPDASQAERDRAFARLKRARSRAIVRLRPLLEQIRCPRSRG